MLALLLAGVSPARANRIPTIPHRGSILAAVAAFVDNRQSGNVLAIQGTTSTLLLRLPRIALGSLTPSPDGRHVVALGCCTPDAAGIWAFGRDGSHLHRIVPLPVSPCGNSLAFGSVVWSPGGHRLAYILYIPSDALRACPPGVRDLTGIWVTPYDHPHPRQVELGTYAVSSPPLSWSPNAGTLAVNGGVGGPSVRAVNVVTGASRTLVRGAGYAVYAPVTGSLAFVTFGSGAGHRTRIWVAGAQGRRRHVLASTTIGLADYPPIWSPDGRSLAYVTDTGTFYQRGARALVVAGAVARRPRTLAAAPNGLLDSPTWSPDGLSLAYIGAGSSLHPGTPASATDAAIFTIDVTTGTRHLLASGRQLVRGLPARSQVSDIAWCVR